MIYRKLRPGEPANVEAAEALLHNFYFDPKRYDLAKVGRYKINKKLAVDSPEGTSELVLSIERYRRNGEVPACSACR